MNKSINLCLFEQHIELYLLIKYEFCFVEICAITICDITISEEVKTQWALSIQN